ncbi:MAG: hypothetical protein QXT53_07960 [Ignisphaera sp.]
MKSIEYLVDMLGDFIYEPKLILIAGYPGAGKTTFCLFDMFVHYGE